MVPLCITYCGPFESQRAVIHCSFFFWRRSEAICFRFTTMRSLEAERSAFSKMKKDSRSSGAENMTEMKTPFLSK